MTDTEFDRVQTVIGQRDHAERRAVAAEAEVARLRDALEAYGQHLTPCALVDTPNPAPHTAPRPPCDCGLWDTLREGL